MMRTNIDIEIVDADFDMALAKAEKKVEEIGGQDFMLSPTIVSRSRTEDGRWRFTVRVYGLD